MYQLTYDNEEDLRKKLEEIIKPEKEIKIECIKENSYKVSFTHQGNSGREEIIYEDGGIKRYTQYSTWPHSGEYKHSETIYHPGGRMYHAMWNNDTDGPWWDGEFKNNKQDGKQRWFWGNKTVQIESIFDDGEHVRTNDYQGEKQGIEYGRADEFFEALRRAQIFNKDIEFTNTKLGGRRMVGFIVNDIWHHMPVRRLDRILGPLGVELKNTK